MLFAQFYVDGIPHEVIQTGFPKRNAFNYKYLFNEQECKAYLQDVFSKSWYAKESLRKLPLLSHCDTDEALTEEFTRLILEGKLKVTWKHDIPPAPLVRQRYEIKDVVLPPQPPTKEPEAKENYKIVIEIAGIDLAGSHSHSLAISEGGRETEQNAKTWSDTPKHRSLVVFDRLSDETAHQLYMVITMKGEPVYKLLLSEQVTPVHKTTEKALWDNVIVPIKPLAFLTEARQRQTSGLLPNGWLYVFWQGKLWRELEVDKGVSYRDVRLSTLRGQDQRPAKGLARTAVWLPYKINNELQTGETGVQLYFSLAQLSWKQIESFESNTQQRQQETTTIDTWQVYQQQQNFELNEGVIGPIKPALLNQQHTSKQAQQQSERQASLLKTDRPLLIAAAYLSINAHKVPVEVAGLQHPEGQRPVLFDEQTPLSSFITQEEKHRTNYYLAPTEKTKTYTLGLSIQSEMDEKPLLLPIKESQQKPVNLAASQTEWSNVFIPIKPLAYSSTKIDKQEANSVRKGWLYIFVNNTLWRELKVNNNTTYQDVDFTTYRETYSGTQSQKADNAYPRRKAVGVPLQEIWLPYKIKGERQTLAITYSEVQWSWPYIQQLESNETMRQQRLQTLDELAIYSQRRGFEVKEGHIAPIENVVFISERVDEELLTDSIRELQTIEEDLQKDNVSSKKTLTAKQERKLSAQIDDALLLIAEKGKYQRHLRATKQQLKNLVKPYQPRKIAAVYLHDPLFIARHNLAKTRLGVHLLKVIMEYVSRRLFFDSAILAYHLFFNGEAQKITYKSVTTYEPKVLRHKLGRLSDHIDKKALDDYLLVSTRQKIRDEIRKYQQIQADWLQGKNNLPITPVSAFKDYFALDGTDYVLAFLVTTELMSELAINPATLDKACNLDTLMDQELKISPPHDKLQKSFLAEGSEFAKCYQPTEQQLSSNTNSETPDDTNEGNGYFRINTFRNCIFQILEEAEKSEKSASHDTFKQGKEAADQAKKTDDIDDYEGNQSEIFKDKELGEAMAEQASVRRLVAMIDFFISTTCISLQETFVKGINQKITGDKIKLLLPSKHLKILYGPTKIYQFHNSSKPIDRHIVNVEIKEVFDEISSSDFTQMQTGKRQVIMNTKQESIASNSPVGVLDEIGYKPIASLRQNPKILYRELKKAHKQGDVLYIELKRDVLPSLYSDTTIALAGEPNVPNGAKWRANILNLTYYLPMALMTVEVINLKVYWESIIEGTKENVILRFLDFSSALADLTYTAYSIHNRFKPRGARVSGTMMAGWGLPVSFLSMAASTVDMFRSLNQKDFDASIGHGTLVGGFTLQFSAMALEASGIVISESLLFTLNGLAIGTIIVVVCTDTPLESWAKNGPFSLSPSSDFFYMHRSHPDQPRASRIAYEQIVSALFSPQLELSQVNDEKVKVEITLPYYDKNSMCLEVITKQKSGVDDHSNPYAHKKIWINDNVVKSIQVTEKKTSQGLTVVTLIYPRKAINDLSLKEQWETKCRINISDRYLIPSPQRRDFTGELLNGGYSTAWAKKTLSPEQSQPFKHYL
ncbi:hypothetical protein KCM76_18335 [Zooshikella marina]|uniref:toxin VasX n=1 Tax=Zooshikella ganghwensis TaxID=202772 RepID=UPI001BB0AACC|nr:toxin VasX [Zooshikella ganghwensis]MBU2707960.1 hypothetical protein [Zooshikella ganghwensis]